MCSFHSFCDEGELMLSLEGHQPHFLISLGFCETGREEIRFLVGKIRKSTTPLLAWHRRCCPMGALGSEPPPAPGTTGASAGLASQCPAQCSHCQLGWKPLWIANPERWQSSLAGHVHCGGCWVQP